MMQAQENRSLYANEQECIRSILDNEGWFGRYPDLPDWATVLPEEDQEGRPENSSIATGNTRGSSPPVLARNDMAGSKK